MKPSLEELSEIVKKRIKPLKKMNLYEIVDAIQTLAEETDTDYIDILEALVGYCWSEEEASEIKNAYNQ